MSRLEKIPVPCIATFLSFLTLSNVYGGLGFVWLKNPHESHSQQIVPQQTLSQLGTATHARVSLAPSDCLSPSARKSLCHLRPQSRRRFGCRFRAP